MRAIFRRAFVTGLFLAFVYWKAPCPKIKKYDWKRRIINEEGD